MTVNINTKNWMNKLKNDVKLSEINIPGTHDSGTKISDFYFSSITDRFSKCQNLTITEQLNSGIRFLDIRLKESNKDLLVYHGMIKQNLIFDKVLLSLKNFLNNNPTEFILLRVENTGEKDKDKDKIFRNVFLNMLNKYEDIIWKPCKESSTVEISKIRGKIIFLKTKSIGSKKNYGLLDSFFIKQDCFNLNTDEKNIEWKFEKITEFYKKCSSKKNKKICINYTSASSDRIKDILKSFLVDSKAIPKYIAREINKKNIEYLKSLKEKKYFGIIVMNFTTITLNKLIINSNFL